MNIDKLLKRENKTRYWLTKRLGITYPTLTRMANGEAERVTLTTLYKMKELLNCTFDELLEVDKEMDLNSHEEPQKEHKDINVKEELEEHKTSACAYTDF